MATLKPNMEMAKNVPSFGDFRTMDKYNIIEIAKQANAGGTIGIPLATKKPINLVPFQRVLYTLCRTEELREAFTHWNEPGYVTPPRLKEAVDRAISGVIANKTFDTTHLANMYDAYNAALMSNGEFRSYNLAAKTCDRIDVTDSLMLYYDDSPQGRKYYADVNAYLEKHEFLSIIPCYTTGLIKITDLIDVGYSIIGINSIDQTIDIAVCVYMTNCWSFNAIPMLMYTDRYVCASPGDSAIIDKYGIDVDVIDTMVFTRETRVIPISTMYTMVNPRSMRWSKNDRTYWRRTVCAFAKTIDGEEHDTSFMCAREVSAYLLAAILCANYQLDKNKQKVRKPSNEQRGENAYDPKAQNERKVHKIGNVTFYSATTPGRSRDDIIVQYKVASWKVRGHTRTYKSGKTVYVKPHVKHRQCMGALAYAVDPAPAEIQIQCSKEQEDKTDVDSG